jgi:ATP/maltotriose-dependent transcriptional regulator MalT/DNA-binding SARP family transcriptional activator
VALPFVTKVLPPRRRGDVVPRRRLLDFLHEHFDRKLLLVCAPAGYGKTTLVTDFAHELEGDVPICWYTLDASDRDPRVFLEYLVESIRQRYPSFGAETRRALGTLDDLRRDLSAVIGTLVNEIHAGVPDLFAIVLDDYQSADGADDVNGAVDQLLRYLPDNCRLLIASRTIPQLTLSRLAASREVAGVGTADLRFEPDELQQLLASNFKLLLRPGQAEALVEQTEGWITGILLTTQSLHQGLFGSGIAAGQSTDQVFAYLTSEVLERQPEDVQEFLLDTAILRRLSPAYCDALTGRADAAELLDYLQSANLFTIRLEGDGDWYRYHQLFREFLVDRLQRRDPERFRTLGRRAADQARGRGEVEDAVAYLLDIRDQAKAAALVEDLAADQLARGRWQTVSEWIDSLPEALVQARPRLLLYRAQIWHQTGEHGKAVALCTKALESIEASTSAELLARLLIARGLALRFKGLYSEAITDFRAAMSSLGESSGPIEAEVRHQIGVALSIQGQIQDGIHELERALDLARAAHDDTTLANTLLSLARALSGNGRLAEALACYDEAQRIFELQGNVDRLSIVLLNLGFLNYCRGDYAGATEILARARLKAHLAGSRHTEAYVRVSEADIQRDQGELEAALRTYESGLNLARQLDEPEIIAYCLDAIGRTYLALGKPLIAEKLIRQAIRIAEERRAEPEVATYQVTLAALQSQMGQPRRAERRLRQAVATLKRTGTQRELPRAHLYAGQICLQLGRKDDAVVELGKVDRDCATLGYDAFLRPLARPLRQLLLLGAAQPFGDRFRGALERGEALAIEQSEAAPTLSPLPAEVGTTMEVRAFGGGRVTVEGRLLQRVDWQSPSASELLFLLLAHPRGLSRDLIIEFLWEAQEIPPSASQLHVTVYRLRRAVGPQRVICRGDRYSFEGGDGFWYDVAEFERLVQDAEALGKGSERLIELSRRAVELYQGPFLPECESLWCGRLRQRLEMQFLLIASGLAEHYAARGEHRLALSVCERILAVNFFEERVHAQMLRSFAALGERGAAALHFQRYGARLANELGEAPSRQLRALYGELFQVAVGARGAL